LPARRNAVAEVGRRRLTSNKLGKRAPKRAAGSSERGSSAERESAGGTVGERFERRDCRESASPVQTRERTGARPRVASDRHLAVVASSKAVRWSRGRGHKGHRILRRVPADRRHSGSSRSVDFHESATTVVFGGPRILRPVRSTRKLKASARLPGSTTRRRVRREDEREVATGMSEARSHHRRGKKTPTLVSPGREAVELKLRD